MNALREQLREAVDLIPEDRLAVVLESVRSYTQDETYPTEWPPKWFGAGKLDITDMSERADDYLAKGFGR